MASHRKQYGAAFISAIPTNIYAPDDSFDLNSSHVLPTLILKAHEAKFSGDDHIVIWVTGAPRREFPTSDDYADACI